jgi:Cu(I)/Ag(I) efflux system membrane fusion protein
MSESRKRAARVVKILFVRLRFVFVFIAVGLIVGNWSLILNVSDKLLGPRSAREEATSEHEWFCPMHPAVVRSDPGAKCPICGMSLSRRKRGEEAELPPAVLARLDLSPERVRQAGVATSEVGYRRLVREIRTAGFVGYDERRLAAITARTAGRVDRLHADFTGAVVRKGEPLVEIYSPQLVTTQEEYALALAALDEASRREQHDTGALERARRLADAARERLRLWGIDEEDITLLEKSRRAAIHLTIRSPLDGTVIERKILAGEYVAEGAELYRIADLSAVWLEAEVFERDLGLIRAGQALEMAFEAYPGESFAGAISFIHPMLDEATRTVRVRAEVENRDGRLKPGMYAVARIRVPLGRSGELWYGCCASCPEIRSAISGECPSCGMELVRRGGVAGGAEEVHDAHTPPPESPGEGATTAERSVFVCDMHPEQVSDVPGTCEKCGGMVLEERKIPPGSKLLYVCPAHPSESSSEPGTCSQSGCDRKLAYRIAAEGSKIAEVWSCPLHPLEEAGGRSSCPACGGGMRLFEIEQPLAVPSSAVVDSGLRKLVFLEKGGGVFEAVEVLLGPRAGEYHQVLGGLLAGDRVVTQGAFLLDAEARLNPAAGVVYFGASGHEAKR